MRVYLVSTALLASGVLTSLQSTLGVRLPIIVSISPVMTAALMSLLRNNALTEEPPCPGAGDLYAMGPALRAIEWQARLRKVQGALLMAGAAQTILGCSGLQSRLRKGIGPVTLAPALILLGVSGVTSKEMSAFTSQPCLILLAVFVVVFALGLRNISLPLPTFSLQSGLVAKHFYVFRMYPVLWAAAALYLVTKISSTADNYPHTDIIAFQEGIENSKWFFFPIPFEWGLPELCWASMVHILPATLLQSTTSMLLMCAGAHVCDEVPPPRSALSRGLTVEGLGLIFGSLWGHGMTADSTNIGLTTFTGIVSRGSVQLSAALMLCASHFPALLSKIVAIPTQFLVAVHLFLQVGLIVTGISILQFAKKSLRDSSVVALSLVFGLLVPKWQTEGPGLILTSYQLLDHILSQCLQSPVFMAMFTGCLLDFCLPDVNKPRQNSRRQEDSGDKTIYRLPTWEQLLCSILEKLPFFNLD